jgi:hypothetical protein
LASARRESLAVDLLLDFSIPFDDLRGARHRSTTPVVIAMTCISCTLSTGKKAASRRRVAGSRALGSTIGGSSGSAHRRAVGMNRSKKRDWRHDWWELCQGSTGILSDPGKAHQRQPFVTSGLGRQWIWTETARGVSWAAVAVCVTPLVVHHGVVPSSSSTSCRRLPATLIAFRLGPRVFLILSFLCAWPWSVDDVDSRPSLCAGPPLGSGISYFWVFASGEQPKV